MKTIIHVATIKKPRSDVFRALTTRAWLSSWWSTEVTTEQAKVGTVVHFRFAGDFNPDMEVAALEAPALLRWRPSSRPSGCSRARAPSRSGGP